MHRYSDLEELLADYIPGAKSAAEISAVERVLENVSVFVDTYCRRPPAYFSPSPAEASIKRVRGEGYHFLRLPVHVFGSIESVTLNGYDIDSSEFYESEKNGWLYFENESFFPERSFDNCSSNIWYDGAVYKVSARWGFDETPSDISEAVRQTVKAIIERQRGVLGQITPSGFVIERALPPLAKEILEKYKKRQFEI